MPWYYAGSDAQPVGPVSLEELQARCASGVVSPETYVIEHTGQPDPTRTWKRYRDAFPAAPMLPPVPPAFPFATPPPAPPLPAPVPVLQPRQHPLFPSATGTKPATGPVFNAPHGPDPYYAKHQVTNAWCGWGFGLGLAGFFLSFICGIGLLAALPGVVISFVGLIQLQKHREQGGHGLAIAGLLLSCVALLFSLIFIASISIPLVKAHEETTTEQSTNDSD